MLILLGFAEMLPCLRGRTLPLARRLLKDTSPGWRRWLFSPAAVSLYQRPPTSRPLPMEPLSAFNLKTRLGLHTSSQCQEAAQERTPTTAVQHRWQEIKKTPKPAFILGVLGATPFMAVPLMMCSMQVYHWGLASGQVLYGACILSFLGGVRWGYTFPDNSPAGPNWSNLAMGAVFPYTAFASLLLMENIEVAAVGLGIGFGLSWVVDVFGIKSLNLAPIAPLWYRWLRGLLTFIVLASLIATVGCSGWYPNAPKRRRRKR